MPIIVDASSIVSRVLDGLCCKGYNVVVGDGVAGRIFAHGCDGGPRLDLLVYEVRRNVFMTAIRTVGARAGQSDRASWRRGGWSHAVRHRKHDSRSSVQGFPIRLAEPLSKPFDWRPDV